MPNEPVNHGWCAKPRGGVGAVGDLVHERVEVAAGAECAANALHEDVVAARGVDGPEEHGDRPPAAVRSADQECPRGIRRQWLVVVGDQLDAVAHRYPQAVMHVVVGGVRW